MPVCCLTELYMHSLSFLCFHRLTLSSVMLTIYRCGPCQSSKTVALYITDVPFLRTQSVASGAVSCSCGGGTDYDLGSMEDWRKKNWILYFSELKPVFSQVTPSSINITNQDPIWPVSCMSCVCESVSPFMAAAQEYPVNRNSWIWYALASGHRRKLICL